MDSLVERIARLETATAGIAADVSELKQDVKTLLAFRAALAAVAAVVSVTVTILISLVRRFG